MNKIDVSKQMSYWLRHDPEDMEMDKQGYVDMDELIEKLKSRFPDVDRDFIQEITEDGKRRYEIKNGKIRALYGHSVDVDLDLPEDKEVVELFRGASSKGAYNILLNGVEAKDRAMVHLSSSEERAEEIGKRRTDSPTILRIDVEAAREEGLRFFKVSDELYLCDGDIPVECVEKCDDV